MKQKNAGNADEPGVLISRTWVRRVILFALAPWVLAAVTISIWFGIKLSREWSGFDRAVRVAEGPWGVIEERRIVISPPLDVVPETFNGMARTPWFMPAVDSAQVAERFERAGLDAGLKASLLDRLRPAPEIQGFVLEPGSAEVRALRPESRAAIYNWLSYCSDRNLQQVEAFRFAGRDLQDWFADSALKPETLKAVEPFIYRNGRLLFFADWPFVAEQIPDHEERRRLLKVLARSATCQIKLRLNDRSDLFSLVDYWGRGKRSKDILPLLRSIKDLPGENSIDIVHLLTRFGRTYLYTYPDLTDDFGTGRVPKDCNWTALNYFNHPPDDALTADKAGIGNIFATRYTPRKSSPEHGDLVVFMNRGMVYHMAIYIADDIVFTKNGGTYGNCWTFMRMEEMIDFYPQPERVTPRFFYLKDQK